MMCSRTLLGSSLILTFLILHCTPSLGQPNDVTRATEVPSKAATTVSTTSSLAAAVRTPIYLQVTLTPGSPDPLGIAQVSGIYGPGAWAAWFLTLCGSWLHTFSSSKYDFNTWASLLYVNWAAIDLIRHSRSLYLLGKAGSTVWSTEAGAVGAAASVITWAVYHYMGQIVCCFVVERVKSGEMFVQRTMTRCAGIFLPALALSIMGFLCMHGPHVDGDESRNLAVLPVLYYKGIQSDLHTSFLVPAVLGDCLIYAAAAAVFVLVISLPETLCRKFVPSMMHRADRMAERYKTELQTALKIYVMIGGISGYILWYYHTVHNRPLYSHTAAFILFAPIWGFGAVILLLTSHAMSIFIMLLVGIPVYLFEAYLLQRAPVSQSCFFMPCAPQSLTDWDQAGSLFIGVCLFGGADVIYPLVSHLRQKRRQRQVLQQDLEVANAQIELQRINRQQNSEIGTLNDVDGAISVEDNSRIRSSTISTR